MIRYDKVMFSSCLLSFLRLPLKTVLSCGRGYFWDLPACTSCLPPADTHSSEDPRMRIYLPRFPLLPTHLQQLSLFHPSICLFSLTEEGEVRRGAALAASVFFLSFFSCCWTSFYHPLLCSGGSRGVGRVVSRVEPCDPCDHLGGFLIPR